MSRHDLEAVICGELEIEVIEISNAQKFQRPNMSIPNRQGPHLTEKVTSSSKWVGEPEYFRMLSVVIWSINIACYQKPIWPHILSSILLWQPEKWCKLWVVLFVTTMNVIGPSGVWGKEPAWHRPFHPEQVGEQQGRDRPLCLRLLGHHQGGQDEKQNADVETLSWNNR